MSQENVEIVRSFIDTLNRGELDAAVSVTASDFELDFSRADGPYRGVYTRDQMKRGFVDFGETFESVRTEPDEFIEVGEHVVVPHTHYLKGRDGIEVHARNTWLVALRDGAIVLIRLYRGREEALEAAALRE
jgi:ketosteroid isomerase-like protein